MAIQFKNREIQLIKGDLSFPPIVEGETEEIPEQIRIALDRIQSFIQTLVNHLREAGVQITGSFSDVEDGTHDKYSIHFIGKFTPDIFDVEEAKLYLKTADDDNNDLIVRIKTAGALQDVILTSPEIKCRICGYKGRTYDPFFDTEKGTMIVKSYCGHSFTMEMVYHGT